MGGTSGRLAALGATLDLHHGLLGSSLAAFRQVVFRTTRSESTKCCVSGRAQMFFRPVTVFEMRPGTFVPPNPSSSSGIDPAMFTGAGVAGFKVRRGEANRLLPAIGSPAVF